MGRFMRFRGRVRGVRLGCCCRCGRRPRGRRRAAASSGFGGGGGGGGGGFSGGGGGSGSGVGNPIVVVLVLRRVRAVPACTWRSAAWRYRRKVRERDRAGADGVGRGRGGRRVLRFVGARGATPRGCSWRARRRGTLATLLGCPRLVGSRPDGRVEAPPGRLRAQGLAQPGVGAGAAADRVRRPGEPRGRHGGPGGGADHGVADARSSWTATGARSCARSRRPSRSRCASTGRWRAAGRARGWWCRSSSERRATTTWTRRSWRRRGRTLAVARRVVDRAGGGGRAAAGVRHRGPGGGRRSTAPRGSTRLDLSLADARFAPDVLEAAARRAVAAWAEAVDGDDAALLEVAHAGGGVGAAVRRRRVAQDAAGGARAAGSADPDRWRWTSSAGAGDDDDRGRGGRAAVCGGSGYGGGGEWVEGPGAAFNGRWTLDLQGAPESGWRLAEVRTAGPQLRTGTSVQARRAIAPPPTTEYNRSFR